MRPSGRETQHLRAVRMTRGAREAARGIAELVAHQRRALGLQLPP